MYQMHDCCTGSVQALYIICYGIALRIRSLLLVLFTTRLTDQPQAGQFG